MKQSYFDRDEFRKYTFYALGEMMLVIIGILIALQIDNWNTENKQEESLKNYLSSIARNIRNDLVAVRAIRTSREATFELSSRELMFISEYESFTVDEITFASYALAEAQRILSFNANSTGYEALKNSGNLEQLQGRDIEQLLYDYYDTVGRIAQAEQSHNEYIRQLGLQVMIDWPADLTQWEFADPGVLAADYLQTLQPAFRQVLRDAKTNALFARAREVGQLLLDYERLERLGDVFIRMNENDAMFFDDATTAALNEIYDPNAGVGYPILIADGKVSLHTYDLGVTASVDSRLVGRSPDAASTAREYPFQFESVKRSDDSLHLAYAGGAEWAAIFFTVRGASATRTSLDFSRFNRLQLELKGDIGGERILVNMKDSMDPDDGSQTDIELELTDQWQTYEIDLTKFENADLSHLHVVLGFLFLEEPQSFSLRIAKFLESDRTPLAEAR